MWKELRLLSDPLVGGDEQELRIGLCKLPSEALELLLEKPVCCFVILAGALFVWTGVFVGTYSMVGGEVDKLPPSDLHSETFLDLLQVPVFEHSDNLLVLFDL